MLRVVSLGVSTCAALMLAPFCVRTLGDRSYGLWTLVATLSTYYALLDLGLSGAVTRHLAAALGKSDPDACQEIVNTALVLYSVVGGLIFLVSGTVAAAGFMFFRVPSELWVFRRVVLIAGAGLAFSVPMRVFFGFLNASFRFDISAAIEILVVLVRSACIVFLLRARFGIVALAWSHLAAALMTLLLSALWSRKVAGGLQVGIHFFRWSRCRELLSYGSISLVAQVADLLRFQVDGFVVASFVGLAAVTHYNIAGSMAQYFISFMLAATGTLGPLFSQLESGNQREHMLRVLRLSTRVAVGLAGFVGFELIALGKPFIHRWMGPEYLDAYPALFALTLGFTIALCQTPSLQLLYGVSRHRLFAVFNSLEGACNLVLSVVLVRHYGLLGVALGTMIPMVLTKFLIQPWYVCKVMNISLAEYWQMMARAMLSTAAALVLPALIALRYASPDYWTLVAVVIASAVCFTIVEFVALFRTEERAAILMLLPKLEARG